jgi:hypothetical protein
LEYEPVVNPAPSGFGFQVLLACFGGKEVSFRGLLCHLRLVEVSGLVLVYIFHLEMEWLVTVEEK